MTSRSCRDSTMSRAVVIPPASLTAVASWPTTAGSVPEWMRTVIEYDPVVARARWMV